MPIVSRYNLRASELASSIPKWTFKTLRREEKFIWLRNEPGGSEGLFPSVCDCKSRGNGRSLSQFEKWKRDGISIN